MDKNQFVFLRQYFGDMFISFILNEDMSKKVNFGDLKQKQYFVLENLLEKIRGKKIQRIDNGDGKIHSFDLQFTNNNGENIYNIYRAINGGTVYSVDEEDELVKLLLEECVRNYPNLIISLRQENHFHMSITSFESHKIFQKLISKDVLNELTNKEETFAHRLDIELEDGTKYSSQIYTLINTIIYQCFQNIVCRMKYSIEDLISEVKTNIECLRSLAKGEEVVFSSFHLVPNLKFEDFNSISLGKNIMRSISRVDLPTKFFDGAISVNGGDNSINGVVIEMSHNAKLKRKGDNSGIKKQNLYEQQREMFNTIQFAFAFGVGVSRTFQRRHSRVGFVLADIGHSGWDKSGGAIIKIEKQSTDGLIEWYDILSNVDYSNIEVSMRRLRYSIFERNDPQDSIVDAIISWEGLFSGRFETTFKVTGAMTILLAEEDGREDLLKELKRYYALRSTIVHGTQEKIDYSELEMKRDRIIDLSVQCLKAILTNQTLLNISSEERNKIIFGLKKA